MGILHDIIHGGPKHQARKEAEDQAKAEAEQVRWKAYSEGLKIGAKKRGRAEGIAKGQSKGGLMGTLERVGTGLAYAEKHGGGLVGDIDFGGMGSGANFGVDAFGMGGGGKRSSSHKRRRSHSRGRERVVYVERERPYRRDGRRY